MDVFPPFPLPQPHQEEEWQKCTAGKKSGVSAEGVAVKRVRLPGGERIDDDFVLEGAVQEPASALCNARDTQTRRHENADCLPFPSVSIVLLTSFPIHSGLRIQQRYEQVLCYTQPVM